MRVAIPERASAEERGLLLYGAATATRRQERRQQAESLAAGVSWAALAQRLRSRKLLTVLGPRLRELADGAEGAEFAAAVNGALAAGRRQSALLELVASRLTGELGEAGIVSAPLKGPRLSEEIYGDPGRRLSSDIDLLVPAERLGEAVGVAERLGYAPPADHTDEWGLPQLHFALPHREGAWPPVELHWRIHWYETRFASEQLLPPRPDDPRWRPRPVAELTALLLFYARDGFIDLRLASDLGAWWDARGGELEHGELARFLHAYPQLRRAAVASARAAEGTVGLPAEPLLDAAAGIGLRGRLACRLANPNPSGSWAQLYADRGLVDALVSPPGGFGAFVRRQLFPPLEIRAVHARIAGRDGAHSLLSRGAGTLARYGVSAARLIAGPETDRLPRDSSGHAPAESIRVMGMEVAATDEHRAARRVVRAAAGGRGVWLITANLDHLRRYRRESRARGLIDAADHVVADGMPLVSASRLAGVPLPGRVAGSDLIWKLCEEAAGEGVSVYLLGGAPGTAERTAAILGERWAELRVAGSCCPPFGFENDPAELARIERALAAARPGLVLVALGFPKQDLLIARLRTLLPEASFAGLGASFSFVAGEIPRAPRWVQRLGGEWLYRLAQEPRRLARRYLRQGLPFAVELFASAARHRLAPRADDGWG
jgi:N-acetylglucosaminyldiphosphoundecaprenol N-acetyl-beta-D-mannosaminyltransferase